MIISKTDFVGVVSLSVNTSSTKVDPFIFEAQRYDLEPLLGRESALIVALEGARTSMSGVTEWSAGTYLTGVKKIYNNKVYQVNVASTTAIPGTNSDWLLKDVLTFWYAYVKRFLVYKSFARMMVEHGIILTQEGVRVKNDNDSIEASPEEKSRMIKKAENNASVEMNLMMKYIENKNWTLDGTGYSRPSDVVTRSRNKSFGIKAIDSIPTQSERDFGLNN